MERRGRIPVATFRTIDGKPRSRSRAREVNINHDDPEMDTFTLLEENFAIKDENEKLKLKIAEYVQNIKQLEEDNLQLRIKIKDLNKTKPEKLVDLQVSAPLLKDSKLLHGSSLNIQPDNAHTPQVKDKAEKLKDFLANPSNEFESLLEIKDDGGEMIPLRSVQSLMSALSQLKANYNSVELQLYEANEEISVLLEYISQIRGEDQNIMVNHQTNSNNSCKNVPLLPQCVKPKNCKNSETNVEEKPTGEVTDKESMRGERIVEVVLTL